MKSSTNRTTSEGDPFINEANNANLITHSGFKNLVHHDDVSDSFFVVIMIL